MASTAHGLAPINRIFPDPVTDASDEQLLQWYADVPRPENWVRFNFVSSLDGAATLEGRSGGLGNAVDQHVFQLLRRLADVILVGAGTVRAEGYGGDLLGAEARQWRASHGRSEHPAVAIVSGSLDLDPHSAFFSEAPVRPLVFTSAGADPARRKELAAVADVVEAGRERVEPAGIVRALAERGLLQIHCEGGPTLLGSFEAAGLVDELCLTVSPLLVGGTGTRIARSGGGHRPQQLRLVHVLESESMLLLRYAMDRPAPAGVPA
jgi:riboflavin biosynthesis pyrimidine reductase